MKAQLSLLHCFIIAPSLIHAQQFDDFTFLWDTHTVNGICLDVLSTVIRCPQALVPHSETIPTVNFLNRDDLKHLCTAECQNDLHSLRAEIEKSCSENDTMAYLGEEYPATYMVDRFLYVYDISCYRDGDQYCNTELDGTRPHLTSWEIEEKDCSNCNLAIWQKQVEAPFGFQEEKASQFSSFVSACSRTGFEVSTPTFDYGMVVTAETTSTALETSTMLLVSMTTDVEVATETIPSEYAKCPIKYTVKENDTCDSISEEHGVDTFGILRLNSFNYCPMLPFAGSNLCLPLPCEVHKIHDFDTCESISEQYNITARDLEHWNAVMGDNCSNMRDLKGWYICVSPPEGPYSMTAELSTVISTEISALTATEVDTVLTTTTTTMDLEPPPASPAAESVSFKLSSPSSTSSMTTVTLTSIHGTRTTTISTIKDTISTFTWHATPSTNRTLPASNYQPSTVGPTYTHSNATTISVPVPSNAMPMSVLDCARWYTAQDGDTCESISTSFDISIVDLQFLNPELEQSCPQLMTGWAYCVTSAGVIDLSTVSSSFIEMATPTTPIVLEPLPFPSGTHGIPPFNATTDVTPYNTTLSARKPLAPGTWKGCSEYRDGVNMTALYETLENFGWDYQILGHLSTDLNNCAYVARTHRTTYPNFLKWNPSLVAHDCLLDIRHSYCARLFPATDADLDFCDDLSRHPGVVPPRSTQENCECYAVIYGADASYYSCERIQTQFGISNPAFLAMNPWIGTADCTTALYSSLGDIEPRAVCVGAPLPISPNPDTWVAAEQSMGRSSRTTRRLGRRTSESQSAARVEARAEKKRRQISDVDVQIDISAKSNDAVAYQAVSGRKDYPPVLRQVGRLPSGHAAAGGEAADTSSSTTFTTSTSTVTSTTTVSILPSPASKARGGALAVVKKAPSLSRGSKMSRRSRAPPRQGPNAPVHLGTDIEGCLHWHTVAPGDDCRTVAAQYGVEDVDFLWWNFGVGKDCQLLQEGYAVCVGRKEFYSS